MRQTGVQTGKEVQTGKHLQRGGDGETECDNINVQVKNTSGILQDPCKANKHGCFMFALKCIAKGNQMLM